MKLRKSLTVILSSLFLFFSIGCQDIQKNNTVNNTKEAETIQNEPQQSLKTEESKDLSIDFGNKFNPPHFLVQAFSIEPKENTLEFQIDYKLSDELFQFILEHQPEVYFSIQYPEKIKKFTTTPASPLVKAPKFTKDTTQRSFQLSFSQELSKKIGETEADKIKEELTGYQLTVFNKSKQPVHIYDDIFYYSQVEYGISDIKEK
ncbi:hypothetical protein [Bacillus marinisedimentorum]|uniref:hypothetical protein n=1 Tax=Bacillus marinisedimentorum TaxID=1821260 RepID=UPI0008725FE6|nr:hypothetical protein [Bacillus marinisedimentorum]